MVMINHFSHQHPLSPFQVDHDDHEDHGDQDQDQLICSGCELELPPGSPAYRCEKPGCGFGLHEVCYELPREIRHGFHACRPGPLSLLFEPPRSFSCAACKGSGTAFAYACRACGFGLHVRCSALPEAIERPDRHRHPLGLVPALPPGLGRRICGACGCGFVEGCWAYFCTECDFAAHLECAIDEDEDREFSEESLSPDMKFGIAERLKEIVV